MSVRIVGIFILGMCLTGIGNHQSKMFGVNGAFQSAIGALVPYTLAACCWLQVLRQSGNDLAQTGVTWCVVSAALDVLMGRFLYHEAFTGTQATGLILGIVVVGLLSK